MTLKIGMKRHCGKLLTKNKINIKCLSVCHQLRTYSSRAIYLITLVSNNFQNPDFFRTQQQLSNGHRCGYGLSKSCSISVLGCRIFSHMDLKNPCILLPSYGLNNRIYLTSLRSNKSIRKKIKIQNFKEDIGKPKNVWQSRCLKKMEAVENHGDIYPGRIWYLKTDMWRV